MKSSLAWVIPVLVASLGSLMAWLRLARQFSGNVKKTQADTLWDASQKLYEETRAELQEARVQIRELAQRVTALERENAALSRANERREWENAALSRENERLSRDVNACLSELKAAKGEGT